MGASWDHFLDTLVKQNDSLSFAFNAPDDCESYFFTLSSKYYWTDFENHPAYKASIDKGAINNFDIELKPATFFKINVTRDMLDSTPDTVFLQIKKVNAENWERWGEIDTVQLQYRFRKTKRQNEKQKANEIRKTKIRIDQRSG